MVITSDIHVHTFLSSCAKADALPESYIGICLEKGIKTIGFADHFWDENVSGASDWYKPQNLEHVLRLRKIVNKDTADIKILFGCETEYTGNGHLAITKKIAQNFDFVLIPPDHFHMKGFTIPTNVTEPAEIRKYLIQHFIDVAAFDLEVPTGIAHPFMPLGSKNKEDIIAEITDLEYRDCFKFAKEKNKSIELNSGVLCENNAEYIRMMKIANECGCKFHIGSDAHTPSKFDIHESFALFAEKCGIKHESILFE